MIILTVEEIFLMHRKLIDKTGGLDGLRDMGMLESAVMNCNLTYGEEELYPSVLKKQRGWHFPFAETIHL